MTFTNYQKFLISFVLSKFRTCTIHGNISHVLYISKLKEMGYLLSIHFCVTPQISGHVNSRVMHLLVTSEIFMPVYYTFLWTCIHQEYIGLSLGTNLLETLDVGYTVQLTYV